MQTTSVRLVLVDAPNVLTAYLVAMRQCAEQQAVGTGLGWAFGWLLVRG